MRIQHVRFKNLNSLTGEWSIDFTDPAFLNDGIFAITGPTGAGKTTLLDAICLALYGRTPRLGRVTQSENEILSRQTGECFAEVLFETQSGRYLCHWSQRRARGKPDGKLQQPLHEVSDAQTEKVLENKLKDVTIFIEEATGMDFDRFTRSMLLAQGAFAAFLQANPDERAPILEQITGTEIYSKISEAVHERNRSEREKQSILQAEVKGIHLLEPEEEKAIEDELSLKNNEEKALATKTEETVKAIEWRKSLDVLQKELGLIVDEEKQLKESQEGFRPEQERLVQADKAASLEGDHASLRAIRKQQKDDQDELSKEEAALPELKTAVDDYADTLKQSEKKTVEEKTVLEKMIPTFRRVRSLNQWLAERQKLIGEEEKTQQEDTSKKTKDEALIEEQDKKKVLLIKDLKTVEDYLQERKADAWLVSGLAGIEEQLSSLASHAQEILRKEKGLKEKQSVLMKSRQSLEEIGKEIGVRRKGVEAASKSLSEEKTKLETRLNGRLLREYRDQKDGLLRELGLIKIIVDQEHLRSKLEDGKACPVCGAEEHPYAEGNVPEVDETEKKIQSLTILIGQIEELENNVRKLQEKEALAQKQLSESENRNGIIAKELESIQQSTTDLEAELKKLRSELGVRRSRAIDSLKPLGITEIPEAEVVSLLDSLKTRKLDWQKKEARKQELEKQLTAAEEERKRLQERVDSVKQALSERQARLDKLRSEQNQAKEERKGIFGDKDPDEEEKLLQQAILKAEKAKEAANEQYLKAVQRFNDVQTRLKTRQTAIQKRAPELRSLEEAFISSLAKQAFADEAAFLEARLSSEQRQALFAKATALQNRAIELKTRHKDREERFVLETARKLTDQTLADLEPLAKDCAEALKALRELIAALKHKLKENASARARIQEKQNQIDTQKEECKRWGRLHELIGSSDGKKFRNFAQGLTFERMVGHANLQLQKMTDRYLLVRDSGQPLVLNVLDNYQAGEQRSTKNLSGGESFIVSLSLALGLSQMASQKVRVDSLFLDEGFGTLDEEALDTALGTLAGLQQEGKLIGIISHVATLKERIRTQITVTPTTGGRSRISGPGCGRVEDDKSPSGRVKQLVD